MDSELIEAGLRLMAATLAGGAIGAERAYHGRAAGFRTHILVCVASALLMLLMQYQWLAVPADQLATIRVDPTRMAQGIMTGIGFLGAGVILHDRQTVRGLTTAASIWITAAIGIILGSGFYAIGAAAGVLVLGTLSLFRWLESHIPSRHYARLVVKAQLDVADLELRLTEILGREGLKMDGYSYVASRSRDCQEIQTTISAFSPRKFTTLHKALLANDLLISFRLLPGNS
ncbi:MgtC/SapB family protein [Gilvimarinus sp. F26214L]|uniref:MgtC/SapB family protein n=1 Tax=Gilvimarinus sp. DZF01 TaxID=3461371 RepID=UPI004045FFA5